MPKPKRKTRQFTRRDTQTRGVAALDAAAERRVKLLALESDLAQHQAIPSADRSANWTDTLVERQDAVAKETRDIAALEARATTLRGGPLTAKENRDRNRGIKQARKDLAGQLVDAWEKDMDGHEQILDTLEVEIAELDAVPAGQRDDAWQDKRDDAQARWDASEAMLDVLERAIATLPVTPVDPAPAEPEPAPAP